METSGLLLSAELKRNERNYVLRDVNKCRQIRRMQATPFITDIYNFSKEYKHIELSVIIQDSRKEKEITLTALVDTGATRSSLSKEAADMLNVEYTGIETVNGAFSSGDVPTAKVYFRMNGIYNHEINVSVLEKNQLYDFILGMDIIKSFENFTIEKTDEGFKLTVSYIDE